MDRIAYVNGAWVPLADARISVLDRGFLFADGVYEVTTVIDGRLVDMAAHLDRLARSADAIRMELAEPRERIAALHAELVARNGLDEGVVYLQATRGAADRDFLPAPDLPPTLVMFTQSRAVIDNPAAARGIRVATMPELRWPRRDIKSVALLAQVLAKQEARERGADEAWLVEDGLVTEGASSTAWIVTGDGRLVTRRPRETATLPGVTALAVAALAAEAGLAVERRGFSVAEAQGAGEAFVTAASSLVLPVVAIDEISVGDGTPGPIARRLRALYVEHARRGG